MKITIWVVRQLEDKDYETLKEWWKFWRFPAPPKNFLPEDGTCGVMVKDSEGTLYAAGFIYLTNSDVAWMEYIVSNPEIKDRKLRRQSQTVLIEQLTYMAKDNEAEWIFTSVKNDSLIERYLECGFSVGSTGTTEMIKQI